MLIPISMAITGVSIQSVGYVLQKIGLEEYSSIKEFYNTSKFRIWILGFLLAFSGSLLFFLALPLSSISVIQPIIGIGPAIVTVFGYFVLKTNLHRNEIIGICLTIIGIFFISYGLESHVSHLNIDEIRFLYLTITIISIIIIFSSFLYRFQLYDLGVEEGILSGVFGAFSSIFGKIGFEKLLNFELHWAIFALVITQTISFLLFQKGINEGKMEKVVSIFTSTAILFPILIGIIFFGEVLNIVNIFGILIILLGVILLTKQYSSLIA